MDKHLSIDVIFSDSRGMVIAQQKCIDFIRQKRKWHNWPIIFIDADAMMEKNLIFRFLEQFEKHPKIKALGAQSLPISYKGWRLDKMLLDKILNCRAYFPKSEVAVNYAPQFHPYADDDPQKIGSEFEKKSKIYFHGRCFALRNQSIWDVPKDSIGEDTYLDRSIHYRFGPGSIRHLYDVHVRFYPITRLSDYLKVRYRIYKDLVDLRRKNPQFDKCREFSKTKLDWGYIRRLPFRWQCAFLIYFIIRQTSHFLFKHNLVYRQRKIDEIWCYKQKVETI